MVIWKFSPLRRWLSLTHLVFWIREGFHGVMAACWEWTGWIQYSLTPCYLGTVVKPARNVWPHASLGSGSG